jgi:DnaK suppressor protein
MANDAPATHSSQLNFKDMLLAEKADLQRQLGELGFGEGGGPTYDPNFADSSHVTAERGEAEVLTGQLREALGYVEAAIARIDEGTFGLCQRCGEAISEPRLEAMPAARLCISCASRP